MNERIKELAEQAGLDLKEMRSDHLGLYLTIYAFEYFDIERFAELIRADEREACANLCEELDDSQTNQSLLELSDCAEAIRQRGEK